MTFYVFSLMNMFELRYTLELFCARMDTVR